MFSPLWDLIGEGAGACTEWISDFVLEESTAEALGEVTEDLVGGGLDLATDALALGMIFQLARKHHSGALNRVIVEVIEDGKEWTEEAKEAVSRYLKEGLWPSRKVMQTYGLTKEKLREIKEEMEQKLQAVKDHVKGDGKTACPDCGKRFKDLSRHKKCKGK